MSETKPVLFDNLGEERETGAAPGAAETSDKLLTVEQLAARLGISRSAIYKRVAADLIPTIRIGSAVRFSWHEVIAFFRQKRKDD